MQPPLLVCTSKSAATEKSVSCRIKTQQQLIMILAQSQEPIDCGPAPSGRCRRRVFLEVSQCISGDWQGRTA